MLKHKSAVHYTGQCIIHLHLSLCKRELGYKCASERMVYPRVHWVGFCFISAFPGICFAFILYLRRIRLTSIPRSSYDFLWISALLQYTSDES